MPEELGTCCSCGGAENVRNVIMLDKKQPIKGKGWGCVVCGLPADGAVAVLCDACLENNAPIRFACLGFPKDNERIAVDLLTEPHRHNSLKHHKLDFSL